MIVLKEKCYLCGHTTEFNINDNEVLYREAKCSYCGASVRNSDIAKIIVEKLLDIDAPLCDVLEELKRYKIMGTSSTGVIHDILKHSPNYIYGEYFDNVKSGQYYKGILCIDLQCIPFGDKEFDLIISEDVIEHIFDAELAFNEFNRVLKTGGYHIFTVPIHESKKTVRRHLRYNKVYHGDPIRKEGALVYTDFGFDTVDILSNFGMETEEFLLHKFYEKHETTDVDLKYNSYIKFKNDLLSFFKYNSIVFCSKKINDEFSMNIRSKSMNYTGERFIPGKAFGEIEVEHLHRYYSLKDIVKDKVVLDAACGEGYGSYILSDYAKFVYGIDISKETIQYATRKYKKHNTIYKEGSIDKLDFEDDSIDVVVSFETIEHVNEEIQVKFLEEIKRVLKKDGILIISTPDKHIYSDLRNYKNEYHVKEFYFDEFNDFLGNYFSNIEFYNQSFESFSVIKSYNKELHNNFNVIDISKSLQNHGRYIIALCSDIHLNYNYIPTLYHYREENIGFQDYIQLFWDDGSGYSEFNSIRNIFHYSQNFINYCIALPKGCLGKLRLDVGSYPAFIQIKNIKIGNKSNLAYSVANDNLKIIGINDIEMIEEKEECITLISVGNDAQIIIDKEIANNNYEDLVLTLDLKILPPNEYEYAKSIKNIMYKKNNVLLTSELMIKEQQRELEVKDNEIASQQRELEVKDNEIASQQGELEVKDNEIASQQRELEVKDNEIASQQRELEVKDNEIASQQKKLEVKNNEIITLQKINDMILNSTSWKITKPIRYIGHILKKML